MDIKKIFITLIVIVVMVMIGAMVINVLLPNVSTQIVNATEDMVFKATGLQFDFNGDGVIGSSNTQYDQAPGGSTQDEQMDVEGFN